MTLPQKEEKTTDIMTRLAIEELAKLEHEQWSHWIKYMAKKGYFVNNLHDLELKQWAEWLALANIPYKELPDEKKESDREWARKVLVILGLDQEKVMRALVSAQITEVT